MESHYSEHNSNLSPTALVYKLIGEIKLLANKLSKKQQRIIHEFCNQMLQHRSAISDATNLLPLEAALFVIQVTERQKINKESTEVYKYFYEQMKECNGRIDQLAGEVSELKDLLDEKA